MVPALGLEIGRDLRRLEDAAVARKNFIAGKAALLPREVRHVRPREQARSAVRQDVAAGGRRRRGARRRGRGGTRCRGRRSRRLHRRRHGRGHGRSRVLRLGLDVERDEQHDQRHAERGKDRDEQRLAARRVLVLRRGVIRRILLPAGHRRIVGPGIVLRLGFIVPVSGRSGVLPAGSGVLPAPAVRRDVFVLPLLRRRLLTPAVGAPARIIRDISSAVGTLHWLHLPFHTQMIFLNVPYSRPYRKDKKCPPVVRRGTKSAC